MLSVILSLALLLPALGSSPAAGPASAVSPTPGPKASAPTAKTVVGQIVAMVREGGTTPADPGGTTIVMRETVRAPRPGSSPGGKDAVSVRIDSGTQLLRGKRPVPLGDLKPGDLAVVRYTPGSPTGRALSVHVADVVTKPAAGGPAGPASPPAIGATN